MKFAEKIIWSCLLTLAILFSIGSSALIYQNHHNLLQTTINQNLSNKLKYLFFVNFLNSLSKFDNMY